MSVPPLSIKDRVAICGPRTPDVLLQKMLAARPRGLLLADTVLDNGLLHKLSTDFIEQMSGLTPGILKGVPRVSASKERHNSTREKTPEDLARIEAARLRQERKKAKHTHD